MTARFKASDVGAFLLIALMIGALFLGGMTAASALPVQDLAQYWSGAHLIRSNPYSQAMYAEWEHSHRVFTEGPPMVMRNPPPALLLVLPLRFMSYQAAFAFWDLLSIVVLTVCARLTFGMVSQENSIVPAVLAFLFGPTIALLMLGQIAIFLLLGVSLFLILIEKRRDWWAGVGLSLIIVKPHIALLFVLAILFWSVRNKRWSVILGGASTVVLASGIVGLLNSNVFAQYSAFIVEFSKEATPYPNLGGLLYVLTGRHILAYLPQIAGVGWLAYYWKKHRHDWTWNTDGMYVLLVSLACCYYSFPFDQIIVLPALMVAFARGNRRIFWSGYIAINIGYFLYIWGIAGRLGFGPMFLWWTYPGWLITFLLAENFSKNDQGSDASASQYLKTT